ncbi:MAG: post-COAP-1 domain-containing protein [Burkholderiales bacterium]
MREILKRYLRGLAALALLAATGSAYAWPCDFMTGGGFIFHNGAKANFGVGGGCKHGTPTWGHLEYIDHGTGLNVHWTSITAYLEEDTSTGPHDQPTGARLICGTASTNLFGDVDFVVQARDAGEPGVNDWFDIRLRKAGVVVYDTTAQCEPHYLGSTAPCAPGAGGGGDIQLHKPNPSTTGYFGGSCPALYGSPPPP